MARKRKNKPVLVPEDVTMTFGNKNVAFVDGEVWAVSMNGTSTFVNLGERRCLHCGRVADCVHQLLAKRERKTLFRLCRGVRGVLPDSERLAIRAFRRGYAETLRASR